MFLFNSLNSSIRSPASLSPLRHLTSLHFSPFQPIDYYRHIHHNAFSQKRTMNSSKTVQLATKPKRAAPKAKYIDPIVQSTFNKDGSLQEVIKALNVRMRDDNPTVVLKSLIVLHTIMRGGSLEPTFSYLVSSSPLTTGTYSSPNTAAYAAYLVARTKSYSNLKRDVIRDKSDRKAANRLRQLGVEQGLLREVRETQRMIAALVEAKFYLDDIDDDVAMTALRLLVKDLLVLFTAVNEGVINVLEHYFEMSHVDASTALKIYKTFCRDTEKVVSFLGVAKKLNNILNVPIPNLKHAPVSLVSSLEEYLNDPNFAANREEYKENKRIADGGAPSSKPAGPTSSPNVAATPSTPPTSSSSTLTNQNGKSAPASFTDFFESIEAAQTNMFNPTTNSPSTMYFQQQATFNPFLTGHPTGMGGMGGGGFLQPQITGNPFLLQQQQQQQHPFFQSSQPTGFSPQAIFQQPTGFQPSPFSPFGDTPFPQPQMTGFPQQLQTQATGANPFRQSMMMTGGGPFGPPSLPSSSPFGTPNQPLLQSQPTGYGSSSPFGNKFTLQLGTIPSSSAFTSTTNTTKLPPLSSSLSPAPTVAAPQPAPAPALVPQKTGARNPFNPSPEELAKQQEKGQKMTAGPSMNALASGGAAGNPFGARGGFGGNSNSFSQGGNSPFGNGAPQPLTQSKTGAVMGSISSEFAFTRPASAAAGSSSTASSAPPPLPTSTAFSSTSFSPSSLSPFPTSSSTFSSAPTSSSLTTFQNSSLPATASPSLATPLRSQSTGFAGSSVKPFQPTSSFGSKLADEFGSTSTGGPISSQPTGFSGSLSSQPTGFGGLLSSQPTGSGAPFNPFRSSTLPGQPTGMGSFGGLGLQSQPTGAFGSSTAFGGSANGTGSGPFGFGSPFGAQQYSSAGQNGNTTGSLI